MLNLETQAHIRHLFYAEHWKIGTIAEQLGVHHDAVRHAIQTDSFHRDLVLRRYITDPYLEFVRETLKNYPQLRATRIFQMVRDRGYPGASCSYGAWWPVCVRYDGKRFCDCACFPESRRKPTGPISAKCGLAGYVGNTELIFARCVRHRREIRP